MKYLFVPICVGILLCFANPFGINQILYCAKTLNNSFINTYILEFLPISIKNYKGLLFFICIFIYILSFIYSKKKLSLDYILLFLGTSFMSLVSSRHMSIFIIFTIPLIQYTEELILIFKSFLYKGIISEGKIVIKICAISFFIITFGCVSLYNECYKSKDYLPESLYPIQSVKYIKENIGTNSRLYNEYFYGTLLMFNNIKDFIDSRCDLYTKEYSKRL